MPQNFRQTEILSIARRNGKVLVENLVQTFDVTPQTIRRDLTYLCEKGKLARVYGGAMLPSGVSNIGYEDRRTLAADEKEAMAHLCAHHIPDDVSIFLNIGTSTEAVARALVSHQNLMVVTNNLNVATILAENPTCEIILTGGVLRRTDGGLVGELAAETIQKFKVDYAIIGTSAMDDDGDLMDFDLREVRVAQSIIAQSRKTFLVADSGKFKRTAPIRICSIAEIDAFFTDSKPSDFFTDICAKNKTLVEWIGHSDEK